VLWAVLLICCCAACIALIRTSQGPKDPLEMTDSEGVAEEAFSHEGKVFIRGELWRATAHQGIIQKGSRVRVKSVKPGLLLVVESVKDPENR
jgi:membrane-bound ClpP family serine protease